MNLQELRTLLAFANNQKEDPQSHIEAWQLLGEFTRVSQAFAPHARDRTMAAAIELGNQGLNTPKDLGDDMWRTVVVPQRVSYQILGNVANRTGGTGLQQPGPEHTFNIDAWA